MALDLSHNDILFLAYFLGPSYIANAMPVLFGGGQSLDLGKDFLDGERVFGVNKTLKGFLSGMIFGFTISILMELILMKGLILLGILASFGSLVGDLFGSFVKRRLKIPPGSPLPVIDQLDFIIGALVFTYPIYHVSLFVIILIFLFTPPIHLLANAMAYILKLKKQFW